MPLHQLIQRVLLIGARLDTPRAPTPAHAPTRLQPLIAALAPAHREFDERAIRFGNRYRSGFWAIYLLSALAVLCAMLPLALGWDNTHAMHPSAGYWVVAEVLVIGTVCAIFWRGEKSDWQGEWLRARTTAELTHYLPLLAPLLDFSTKPGEPNWYLRLLDPGQHLRVAGDVARLCAAHEPRARELLEEAWSDANFVSTYAQWAIDTLDGQRQYHNRVARRSHALLHRVHRITIGLFGLTAFAAVAHLAIHSIWLSLITTVSPALAASLHGALAQSESYRLHATSQRVAVDLQRLVEEIRVAMSKPEGPDLDALKTGIRSALGLVLEEHQDWHMLVRPHQLPLA
jgi:hypothetical protein